MSTLYRFTVQGICSKCGQPGEVRGGIIFGPLTLAEAICLAIQDACEPLREPLLIVDDGKVIFDAAEIRKKVAGEALLD